MKSKLIVTALCCLSVLELTDCKSEHTLAPSSSPAIAQHEAAEPDWTVLVYMNAKNNLEPFSVTNFQQIAKVPDSASVNVLLELGRRSWQHVYRIKMRHDMELNQEPFGSANGISDIGAADMGSLDTLDSFAGWAKQTYPAKHYMLIVWDHGQGFRLEFAANVQAPKAVKLLQMGHLLAAVPLSQAATQPAQLHPLSSYRAISYDDITGNHLFNSDVQAVVEKYHPDVVGFDACLMSMIETGYAIKQSALVMIASEELEPGYGWKYDDWLSRLVQNPQMEPSALGDTVVAAYQRLYGNGVSADPTATLASIRLDQINALANGMSQLADALSAGLDQPNVRAQIYAAREACEIYAPCESVPDYGPAEVGDPSQFPRFSYVDIGAICEALSRSVNDSSIQSNAKNVLAMLSICIPSGASWAGVARNTSPWSSNGLSIYFPISGRVYRNDEANPEINAGYDPNNQDHPVAFVRNTNIHWAEFLKKYCASFPNGVPKIPDGCP